MKTKENALNLFLSACFLLGLTAAQSVAAINFPGGRIAISHDGNNYDKEDYKPLLESLEHDADVEIMGTFTEGGPASHGMKALKESLTGKAVEGEYIIIAGLSSGENQATELLRKLKLSLPEGEEAVRIQKTTYDGKPAIVLCGSDEVGLMYAFLDTAKRISWAEGSDDLFAHVMDIAEAPDVKERTVSVCTINRRYFEERLHDAEYWAAYFDMMAENRLNQFLLIFGYDNGQYREPTFTAPVYPYFMDVEGYPYVKLSGLSSEQQTQNRESLQKMIDLAHERGIEFGVGLWDQIDKPKKYPFPARDDIEAPADLPRNLIWGLTQKNLVPYTKLALSEFLETFPDIDLIQFRMHWESGIKGDVALKFWKEIFGMIKEQCPDIKIEARAKDVPDETLYDGVDTGADFRVATKHWMEQMGMPFHPTHINKANQHDRRHGYADLLRYPKRYGFKWRLWSGGTTRALLWGDPEWVKLFAEGVHLYDGVGYEFNEPLYFKMNGSKHDAPTTDLLNPEHQYTPYEFERYWHYFQVMGRVGYNPDTPADVWEMEFKNRFGEKAGLELMEALHLASRVLPRIVSASYLPSRFPSPQGWPELQRMDSLEEFAEESKPSDIQQFASPKEEAELIMRGAFTVRRTPSQTSQWFLQTAHEILERVEKAERGLGDKQSKEFVSTVTDLKMLAQLARYHANRLQAAVRYNLYRLSGDLQFYDKAIDLETRAVAAYGSLVKAAGNVYNMKLDFGSRKSLFPGHWKDEHQKLVKELAALKKACKTARPKPDITPVSFWVREGDDQEPPLAELDRIHEAPLNKALKVSANVEDPSGVKFVNLRYRRVTQFEDYELAKMVLNASTGRYEATIPASFFEGQYDVMYFVEAMDTVGNGRMVPDMEAETPYVIVHVQRKEK